MWREDLLMLQRGGELAMRLLGGSLESVFGSVWCWCLFPLTSACVTRVCALFQAQNSAGGLSAFPQGMSSPTTAAMTSRSFSPFNRKQCCPFSCNLPFHWIWTAQWWCRWRFATQDSVLEELLISYSLKRSSKHFEEQKLKSFYGKEFSVVVDLHLEM